MCARMQRAVVRAKGLSDNCLREENTVLYLFGPKMFFLPHREEEVNGDSGETLKVMYFYIFKVIF